VLDLMATLISGGNSTEEISRSGKEIGVSQVFIAIDIISQTGAGHVDETVNAILDDFLDTPSLEDAQQVRYPGQGMLAARKENLEKGILVDPEAWQTILNM
jgi:3-dehydro-L-gulonate 2-dehydrogenase